MLRQQCLRAQEYIKELEAKLLQQESQVAQLLSRSESVDFDHKRGNELEFMRKKYDDKCSEMLGLVKRLNSLTAFKNKMMSSQPLKETRTVESRDASPMPAASLLKRKIKTYKALYANDIHIAPTATKRVIERSKSTERLQSKTSRSSSRLRGNMSSTVKKGV